jgi:hypothetical protein
MGERENGEWGNGEWGNGERRNGEWRNGEWGNEERGVTGESGNYELLLIRNINHMYGGKKNRKRKQKFDGNRGITKL